MEALDNGHEISDLEGMVDHYNRSFHGVLDKHTPIKTKKCVIKKKTATMGHTEHWKFHYFYLLFIFQLI